MPPENARSDAPIGPDYSILLYRYIPETRRFHRWILRRRTQRIVMFAGVPTSFSWNRSLNSPSGLSVTAEDPMALLSRMRL